MSPNESGKQWPELPGDSLHQVREMLEGWKDRPNLHNRQFVERYIQVECQILLHFTIGRSAVKFVAFLHRDFSEYLIDTNGGDEINHLLARELAGKLLDDSWRNAMHLILRADREQQSVFTDVVKGVQAPKSTVGEEFIQTFIWFDRADKVCNILPKVLYNSVHSGFVLFGRITDRKASVPWRSSGVSDFKQLVNDVIERTPKVAEYISNDGGDFEREGLGAVDIVNQLSRLRITLGSDHIGLRASPSQNFTLQIREMLFWPGQFLLRWAQIYPHHACSEFNHRIAMLSYLNFVASLAKYRDC
jgi:hypothetical protein